MSNDYIEDDYDESQSGARAFSIQPVPQSSFDYLGFKWGIRAFGLPAGPVSWSFSSQPGTIAMVETAYRSEVISAFNRWGAIADVAFSQLPDGSNADIEISWDAIDGTNGIVGLASYRTTLTGAQLEGPSSVTIELDIADYDRNAGSAAVQASSFEMVVAHEIGHALGLEHDTDPNALLYDTLPALSDYSTFSLSPSDIAAIQILYGAAAGATVRGVIGTVGVDNLSYPLSNPSLTVFAEAGNDSVTTGNGDDTIDGGIGDDVVSSNGGDDFVFGSFGNDNLDGGAGADTLKDSDGDNVLSGQSGNDTLYGGSGDDNLSGGSGHDVLVGDAFGSGFGFGNDTLAGGAGNDTLFGGFGQDTFVFAANGGSDVITTVAGTGGALPFADPTRDFEIGIDTLDMTAFGFASAAAGLAATTITGNSGDTVIAVGGTVITVVGVDVTLFDTGDFQWV